MTSLSLIICSLLYLGILFGIADWAERQRARGHTGRGIVGNSYVYALSLAVYCTAWTFYGSVGKAASEGVGFLSVYIGPTLMAPLWWLILRKMIRICKRQGITNIADFISARYGKSRGLGVLVTLICVIGITPYISIQIRAIATSFASLSGKGSSIKPISFLSDHAFLLTLLLALFAILFGTRKLEANERHEGLVAAIAFESLVKLVAFVAVGAFVTFGLFNGPGDIFGRAASLPKLADNFHFGPGHSTSDWFWESLLSGFAVLFLPRQFQVAVVENVDEKHLNKAMWLFPLYLFLITLFVLPMAFGGQLVLGASANPDEYVLFLPLRNNQPGLAMLAYLGGFSAATSMIIIETTALSVMISNNLVMPLLLTRPSWQNRWGMHPASFVLNTRRLAILALLLLAYVYYRVVSDRLPLVSVGMISFAAVAQFAPAIIGGLFWKQGSFAGARLGLLAGCGIWFYTLVLPTIIPADWHPTILTNAPSVLRLLHPNALFGLHHYGPIAHSVFWSLLINTGLYVWGSLRQSQRATDVNQAVLFVDVFRLERSHPVAWKGTALLTDIQGLLATFFGRERAIHILERYIRRFSIDSSQPFADPRLVTQAERILAGAVGAASARILVSSVTKEEPLSTGEVIQILKSSQELMIANKKLIRQSSELQQLTSQLRDVNERLQRADQQKDDFLSTVTHEIRTPITSIRALTEILQDEPDLEIDIRQQFLTTIVRESERLTRLIDQILELDRIQSGRIPLSLTEVSLTNLILESVETVRPLAADKKLTISIDAPARPVSIMADYDRLMQVMINLLSNAVKFSPEGSLPIDVRLLTDQHSCIVDVTDRGIGIDPVHQELIFDKFYQAHPSGPRKPKGSGLGLAISRMLVELHQGALSVRSKPGHGSTFTIQLPLLVNTSVNNDISNSYLH